MKRLKLPSGMHYGYNADNQRICVGAIMGRRNNLPNFKLEGRLRMVKLRWVDGDYDEGGAYWGGGGIGDIYWATDENGVEVFVRAVSRTNAKQLVRKLIPEARFYN